MVSALDKRIQLTSVLPTPIESMDRLADQLGMNVGTLWVKRDDLTGLAGGGNKARKLEYLCADALSQGCDVLVTGGGRQSNHVRMTAAAANKLGLDCTVVISSTRPRVATGNVVLDELLAPDIVWAGELDYYGAEAAIEATCDRLAAEGRKPYRMPIGGASSVGALGYVAAADELCEQLPRIDLVVVADGSGGTHAGLVAGFGDHARVLGVDVGTRPDLVDQVPAKAKDIASLAGREQPAGSVQLDRNSFGTGYGAPTDACREALDLAARFEGLLLDPVYTGKAMVGLISGIREGRIERDKTVVFLHTGGLPALFATAYSEWIRARSVRR